MDRYIGVVVFGMAIVLDILFCLGGAIPYPIALILGILLGALAGLTLPLGKRMR